MEGVSGKTILLYGNGQVFSCWTVTGFEFILLCMDDERYYGVKSKVRVLCSGPSGIVWNSSYAIPVKV